MLKELFARVFGGSQDRGFEKRASRWLRSFLEGADPGKPKTTYDKKNGTLRGSRNHELLSAVIGYAAKLEWGRPLLVTLLNAELKYIGLMRSELLSPSHAQWHLVGITALLIIAREREDAEIVGLCLEWFRRLVAICLPFRSPKTKRIVAPGGRANNNLFASNDWLNLWMRFIRDGEKKALIRRNPAARGAAGDLGLDYAPEAFSDADLRVLRAVEPEDAKDVVIVGVLHLARDERGHRAWWNGAPPGAQVAVTADYQTGEELGYTSPPFGFFAGEDFKQIGRAA